MPECFLSILNAAQKLVDCASKEVSTDALMLIEYVKELYMNFPLRGQKPTITCSHFSESELYSLTNEDMKAHHRASIEKANLVGGEDKLAKALEASDTELREYLSIGPQAERQREILKPDDEKDKIIYLSYGTHTIISITQAPQFASKIVVRNLTGTHGWVLTRHRVLEHNCLESFGCSDRAAVYGSVLAFRGACELEDVISGRPRKKQELYDKLKEAIKFVPEDESKKIEEDLKKIEESDSLIKVFSVLGKHYGDMKIVFVLGNERS